MKKLKVGILFGGKSAEHEVSLQSAKNVYEALDREKYDPLLIGIGKNGRWFLVDDSSFILDGDDPERIRLGESADEIAVAPQCRGRIFNFSKSKDFHGVDVVFPILHGPFGEDGTVQGLLKLAEIPFVGAGVLASAVSMDKDIMKRLLAHSGIPIAGFIALNQWEEAPDFEGVSRKFGLPFFIKPANMGSSVGVSKVSLKGEYLAAVKDAFKYDTKIIIEEFIAGRELECSVLGSAFDVAGGVAASIPGEVIPNHGFYSYDAKYIDKDGAALVIPAGISEEISARIKDLSVKVFKTLCCDGLGRVDFFLKEDGSLVVNEINTMPGFTRISMYPKLWEASGLSYTDLIDRLIKAAMLRFEKESRLDTCRNEF